MAILAMEVNHLFKLTGSAHAKLDEALKKEQREGEKLYIRLSMGIG